MEIKNGRDIPLGFGMALMQNPGAYSVFAELEAEQQKKLIEGTKGIESRDEMRNYVSGIPDMF